MSTDNKIKEKLFPISKWKGSWEFVEEVLGTYDKALLKVRKLESEDKDGYIYRIYDDR